MLLTRQRPVTAVPARSAASVTRSVATESDGQPLPLAGDAVQWGVVRQSGCFDVGDSRRHTGLTQHAFRLGDDRVAVCGFRTPMQGDWDAVRRPLLAMPSLENPRCRPCAGQVLPFARSAPSRGVGVQPMAHPTPGAGAGHPPMARPLSWLEGRLMASGVGPGTDPRAPLPAPLRPVIKVPVHSTSGDLSPVDPGAAAALVASSHRAVTLPPWMRRHAPLAIHVDDGESSVVTAAPDGRRAFILEDRAARLGY